MNSQHKEKILKSFLTEVIKRCQSNKGAKVNIDPIKVISDELLVSSNYDESAKKNEPSNEVTVKQGDRPKIINFFKSVFNPNESSDPSAFDSNSSRLSKSFLPDFLHHEGAEILKSCDNEPDSEHLRKELRSLMYQSSNFSSLLDHIVLWIEEYDLRCKKFTAYLGTKKIDLRENTFFPG
ncbi:hypothetical protein [Desulfonatronovibrio magnus]|uniref:hypothetical protein n=1 Tax=Desulfonatronovibrio magnus TaxID=698827 RepID=UPI0005EAEB53|nr:hypothetical protein [Desulfonatronovibrio magnus]